MKLCMTIVARFDVGEREQWAEAFPGCETIAEVAQKQQEWLDDGSCMIEDLLEASSDMNVTIEPTFANGE